MGLIQTTWEFCDDRSNENGFARAFGGPVVRVNAGGMPPPDAPSVGDVTGHSPFLPP